MAIHISDLPSLGKFINKSLRISESVRFGYKKSKIKKRIRIVQSSSVSLNIFYSSKQELFLRYFKLLILIIHDTSK